MVAIILKVLIEMRKKNALLMVSVGAFALLMTSATNAAYRCVWVDGSKVCGNELGFAPAAGGEQNSRDRFSGDHGDRDNSRDSDSAGASEGHDNCGGVGAQ